MNGVLEESCGQCGRIKAHEPRLLRLTSGRQLISYWCSQCGNQIVKPVMPTALSVYMTLGLDFIDTPEEVLEHPALHEAPPINEDDEVAFGLAIEACEFPSLDAWLQ